MKIRLNIMLCLLIILCILTLYSGISHSGVAGSKHDLSIGGTGLFSYDTEEVCVFCHTPHGANSGIRPSLVLNASSGYQEGSSPPFLLWNRSRPTLPGTTPYFSIYTSSSLDVSVGEIRAYSILCLSCHDGISALNVLANPPGATEGPVEPFWIQNPDGYTMFAQVFNSTSTTGWGPNIGDRESSSDLINLSNDHPISFDYPQVGEHPDVPQGLVPRTGDYVGVPAVRLFSNPSGQVVSMECSTCHDVHNEGEDGAFLTLTIQNSALCTNCHNK